MPKKTSKKKAKKKSTAMSSRARQEKLRNARRADGYITRTYWIKAELEDEIKDHIDKRNAELDNA